MPTVLTGTGVTFKEFVGGARGVVNTYLIPTIVALAFLLFVWGIVNYFFLNGGNEDKRAEGRVFVIWGLVALAVLFSLWAIVNVLLSTLGVAP